MVLQAQDRHHHEYCIEKALNTAEAVCQKKGTRLTKLRRKVLELIWKGHEPIKAYDLLSDLQKEDASAKPTTVYRALDFLQENALIHKVHRLNAYIGCPHPEHKNPYFLLICTDCRSVTESESESYRLFLEEIKTKYRFHHSGQIFEIEGKCTNCAT